MRVISGKYRGRKLTDFRGEIRPTSDRLRESLFSILQDEMVHSTWLDLFAGSGAVGIEALSRGANYVVFNDKNRSALKLIDRNLKVCGIDADYEVWGVDAFVALRRVSCQKTISHFFLDPPYRFGRYSKLLQRIIESSLWSPDSIIMLEIFKKTLVDIPDALTEKRRVEAGDSHLLFLESARRGH